MNVTTPGNRPLLSQLSNGPYGLLSTSFGEVLVSDFCSHRIFKLNVAASTVENIAGNGAAAKKDGAAAASSFQGPRGLCMGPDGELYIADSGNHCIRVLQNGVVTTLAGSGKKGFKDHTDPMQAQFKHPYWIALHPTNRSMYIADTENQRVRVIDGDSHVVTSIGNGTEQTVDGNSLSCSFDTPRWVGFSPISKELFIGQSFVVRKMDSTGMVSTYAGGAEGYKDGPLLEAQFSGCLAFLFAPNGDLYASDYNNSKIRRIDDTHVVTIAGSSEGFGDGVADCARFKYPIGLCWHGYGSLLVADYANKVVRLISNVLDVGNLDSLRKKSCKVSFDSYIEHARKENKCDFVITHKHSSTVISYPLPLVTLVYPALINDSNKQRLCNSHASPEAISMMFNLLTSTHQSFAISNSEEIVLQTQLECHVRLGLIAREYIMESIGNCDADLINFLVASMQTALQRASAEILSRLIVHIATKCEEYMGTARLVLPHLAEALSENPSAMEHIVEKLYDHHRTYFLSINSELIRPKFRSHTSTDSASSFLAFLKLKISNLYLWSLGEEPAAPLNDRIDVSDVNAHAEGFGLSPAMVSEMKRLRARELPKCLAPNFTIIIPQGSVLCHDWVLYARWSYFGNVLDAGLQESATKEMHFNSYFNNVSTLKAFVYYIYTDDPSWFTNDDDCFDILRCSRELQLCDDHLEPAAEFVKLLEHCRQSLIKHMTPENFVNRLTMTMQIGTPLQQKTVRRWVFTNGAQIIADPKAKQQIMELNEKFPKLFAEIFLDAFDPK